MGADDKDLSGQIPNRASKKSFKLTSVLLRAGQALYYWFPPSEPLEMILFQHWYWYFPVYDSKTLVYVWILEQVVPTVMAEVVVLQNRPSHSEACVRRYCLLRLGPDAGFSGSLRTLALLAQESGRALLVYCDVVEPTSSDR